MNSVHDDGTVEALRGLNLNALVALLALLETESVSEAARRAGISQSAMSHALRQLRERFDDPLLVRSGPALVRTPRAIALTPILASALREVQRAVAPPPKWDPATATRRFSLATGDYFALVILPPLLERLSHEAPGVSLDVRGTGSASVREALETGDHDLAVVRLGPDSAPLSQRKILTDTFACLVRKGHPAVGKRLTLARFLALPHALISPSGSGIGVVDSVLAERGLSRRIALRVPSFLLAPLVVERSDLVLTAPRRVAEVFAATHAVDVHAPPIAVPPFDLHLVWHPRLDADPAHVWLRERIVAAVKDR